MAANNPNSPRQRLINLMYLVFIAMLALNVSSEVLDGFDLVEDGLQQTIKGIEERNGIVYSEIKGIYQLNPVKAEAWNSKATLFVKEADSLFNYIQSMKVQMVKRADGANGDVNNIENKEDLDAASETMLSPLDNKGEQLRLFVDFFRGQSVAAVGSDLKKKIIEERLSTKPSRKARGSKNWEQSLFEEMPLAAAVTLLTKLQADVRSVQGLVLEELRISIDVGDYRVNTLDALVIPKSMIVMSGGVYEGQIVLAAVDSTKRPKIYIGNTLLAEDKKGSFSIAAGGVGVDKAFTGRVVWERPGQDDLIIPFATKYTVVEPMATIEALKMNVLYAGIANELSISVPGLTNDRLSAQVVNGNGSLSRTGNLWIAKPSKVGQDMIISVTAKVGDVTREVAKKQFKVRALPDPIPYIEYADANGNAKMFKGGKLAKATIVNATAVKAAIDDGLLNIPFTVLRFSTVFFDGMGNAVRDMSNGANFSEKQNEQIRRLSRGKSFFISDVRAKGPDGIERDLSAIEVRIN